jgi:hypothetical protein
MARYFFKLALLAWALLAAAVPAQAQHEEQWLSYRDAYRAMLPFEKYGQPKNFLQIHYRIVPKTPAATLDGLRLELRGKSTQINLPLDETGRAVFPLLKSAYDDNAVLVLNRNLAQYEWRPQVSIVVRSDGGYDSADLRAACAQALGFERYLNLPGAGGRKCAGVRFVFGKKGGAAEVRLREGGVERTLAGASGAAFPGDGGGYPQVLVRFGGAADKWQVISPEPPLAVVPVFE